jgi:hypothetical protein
MSRVGFKKSFGAGGMDASTLYSEFYLTLKSHLTTAGFVTLVDDQVDPGFEEYFHFIQAGADGATEHDDVPRWMISFDANGPANCLAAAKFGETKSTVDVVIASDSWGPGEDIELWFAADGAAGWWWLAVMHTDPGAESGYLMDALTIATPVRRYMADQHTGLVARYGLLQLSEMLRRWMPPYAIDAEGIEHTYGSEQTGDLFGAAAFDLFSPLGGTTLLANRHVGSPLPPILAPIFPVHPATPMISASMLGDFLAVMQITDGNTLGNTVLPGWIALTTGDPAVMPAVAVPAPDSFTLIPW